MSCKMGTNKIIGKSMRLILLQLVWFITFSVYGHEVLPTQFEIEEMMFLNRNQDMNIERQTENPHRIKNEELKGKLELVAVAAAIWNQWFLGQQLRHQLYNDRKDSNGDITKRNSELTSTIMGIPRTIIDRHHPMSSTTSVLRAMGTTNVKHQRVE